MLQNNPRPKTLVLVVEMDPMCRRVVERILNESCQITTSCDYEEIISLLKREKFDTLFVDNDLPSPGAIPLFETAAKLAPSTRRVLMTGEHVDNLQYYLKVGLIDAFVTRTTPSSTIERAVTGAA